MYTFQYGYGSIPIKIPFVSGMNIHKSQLFWCEQKGYKVLTHCHILDILEYWKYIGDDLDPWTGQSHQTASMNGTTYHPLVLGHWEAVLFRGIESSNPWLMAVLFLIWGWYAPGFAAADLLLSHWLVHHDQNFIYPWCLDSHCEMNDHTTYTYIYHVLNHDTRGLSDFELQQCFVAVAYNRLW